jgi:hypothetical protein
MVDVDRILDGEAVGAASAIARRIGIAKDLAIAFGDDIGQAFLRTSAKRSRMSSTVGATSSNEARPCWTWWA